MPSLLIADDDAAIRGLLVLIGRRRGFSVDTASDGFAALQLLSARPYDIAILDLMMPRMNGYDLVARIPGLEWRPVVLIATAAADGFIAQLDATVVHSLIRKPFDIDVVGTLLTELARALEPESTASPARDAQSESTAAPPCHDPVS
jgi:two-component system, NtrC family, response regulator HydG